MLNPAKNTKRFTSKFLARCVAMVMLFMLLPATAAAQGGLPLDLANGSIIITSTGYSQGGGAENAYTGGYVITGTTLSNTVQVTSGTHSITLNSASISIPATTAATTTTAGSVCAFSITGNASVSVTLQGSNALTSAAGYAGVYVMAGSALTVNGTGSLTVTGGAGRPVSSGTPSYGGGAGIGGNGYIDSSSFGSITIGGGTITATGGVTSASVNYGAGAGIGSGGMSGGPSAAYPNPDGSIIINGGTITAAGGKCINSSDTGGGTGIGSGGSNLELNSHVTIEIHGGAIVANGNNDAAGIGTGANCHSGGKILIDGGDIQAYGAGEGGSSTWGGAGIGGGDMGWVSSISIGGSAVVTARGAGAAAGIGGGNYGGVWDIGSDVIGSIVISGNANVTAFGSSAVSGGNDVGGAGIGAGRNYGAYHYNSGIIIIKDKANVTAYAGKNAQAIGVGSGYDYATAAEGEDILIVADDTVSLRLFNQDTRFPAYTPTVQGNGEPLLVAFTLNESGLGAFPGIGARTNATKGAGFAWEYAGSPGSYDLTLFENSQQVDAFHSVHAAFGNWAVLRAAAPQPELYTLTVVNGAGSGQYAADTPVAIVADPPPPGKFFDHWETNNGGVFADKDSPETVFTMPANDVRVTAVYLDINPRTGDNSPAQAWSSLALFSLLGMACLFVNKKIMI